jgi:hypothetical protein
MMEMKANVKVNSMEMVHQQEQAEEQNERVKLGTLKQDGIEE